MKTRCSVTEKLAYSQNGVLTTTEAGIQAFSSVQFKFAHLHFTKTKKILSHYRITGTVWWNRKQVYDWLNKIKLFVCQIMQTWNYFKLNHAGFHSRVKRKVNGVEIKVSHWTKMDSFYFRHTVCDINYLPSKIQLLKVDWCMFLLE